MASCFQLLLSMLLNAAEHPGADFCCPIPGEGFSPTDEVAGAQLPGLKKSFSHLQDKVHISMLGIQDPCLRIHMQSLLKTFAQIPLMLFANPDPPLPLGDVCILTQIC